jgi:hypothetical protein
MIIQTLIAENIHLREKTIHKETPPNLMHESKRQRDENSESFES